MKILVMIKILVSKFICINSFCKECGRRVRDFYVEDNIWMQVDPLIKYGHTLCYNCFCEKCEEIGLPFCWKLSPLKENNDGICNIQSRANIDRCEMAHSRVIQDYFIEEAMERNREF